MHSKLNINGHNLLAYRLASKKGEGTFSEVLKAKNILTGKFVAIKCMKNHYSTQSQVNKNTSSHLFNTFLG